MSWDIHIDRCLCFNVTFASLQVEAQSSGADSLCALQERVEFGRKCQLCHPYVRRMLRTGETVFREIVTDDDEPNSAAQPSAHQAPQPLAGNTKCR